METFLHSKKVIVIFFVLVVSITIFIISTRPSHSKVWSKDQAVLPSVRIENNTVYINNIRNTNYRSTTDYDVNYINDSFDATLLDSVILYIEPIDKKFGIAHTFLTYRFKDGKDLTVSGEIRKEVGEGFDPLPALLRQFEFMQVIGTEEDILGLRVNHRRHDVMMYKLDLSQDELKNLFLYSIGRAIEVEKKPELYNLLTNSCAANITFGLSSVQPEVEPLGIRVFLPLTLDKKLIEDGVINDVMPTVITQENYAEFVGHVNTKKQNAP